MNNLQKVSQEKWFQNLPYEQREFLQQSIFLVQDMANHPRQFFDYSFVMMPAAKAYEGFTKDVLFHFRLISERLYWGTKLRVGKSLNPELENVPYLKKEALFNELTRCFGEETIPQMMWETWKACRNRVFHYFCKSPQILTFDEAKERLDQILTTVQSVLNHPKYLGDLS